jgi:hypothetical protein
LDNQKKIWILIPFFGIIIFLVLYLVATCYYPGGSQADKYAVGFSWANNYWCNLLNDTAINGKPNPAKPIAISGMIVLCLALSFFWMLFPRLVNIGNLARLTTQVSGILGMFIACFLFTQIDHDIVTNLASVFGIIAAVGIFIGLYKIKWYGLFAFGFFNILLVVLNNYLYYHEGLIIYLPIIQKISFLSFLIWVSSIDINLYQSRLFTGVKQ